MSKAGYQDLMKMIKSQRKFKKRLAFLPFPLIKRMMRWAVMKKKTDGFTPQEKAAMEELCGAMPIHQYVIEQRLAQAAQLLLEGDWNVSEVAAIVGYGKASNFAAAFKKRYGVAPKNYRGSRFDSAKNKV